MGSVITSSRDQGWTSRGSVSFSFSRGALGGEGFGRRGCDERDADAAEKARVGERATAGTTAPPGSVISCANATRDDDLSPAVDARRRSGEGSRWCSLSPVAHAWENAPFVARGVHGDARGRHEIRAAATSARRMTTESTLPPEPAPTRLARHSRAPEWPREEGRTNDRLHGNRREKRSGVPKLPRGVTHSRTRRGVSGTSLSRDADHERSEVDRTRVERFLTA